MTTAVAFEAVTKRFGSTEALRGVTLEIPSGSVFGIIGPNGAGKTTAMRILLDLMRPSSGSVKVLGFGPREGGVALRRNIGYLPGELILEGRVTGAALLAHYTRLSGHVRRGRITELADRLGVDLHRQVRTLSKGNKQKLGIIQALMHEPELLILDEPTSGIDPLVQQTFHALVHEAQDRGATVLLSSHVLSEVEQVAEQVAILKQGEIVTTSTVLALRETAKRRISAVLSGADASEVRASLASIPNLGEVRVVEQENALTLRLTGVLGGNPDPLVKALAAFSVADVSIEAPNLEDAVLDLYGQNGGAS
ncbi:ABC transporter ATP-binding protein [Leucobacter coleopterorum]|uniref:ABC transporter ATP-binding protein n=1 Tax=Leucobacter coleopterorum TaxID=2714933 RepID=A0ABX6JXQ2_9MICO|nr:ABC transporter ATP-binding protein [Leucobacter coleopterorum]QIM18736.1 ABC transporter ATP-binding protein [Leucobacter coleopterorum]